MEEIKKAEPENIVEVVADKGYENTEDMVSCLENGIIPHVITDDGKEGYEIETPYEKIESRSYQHSPRGIKESPACGTDTGSL